MAANEVSPRRCLFGPSAHPWRSRASSPIHQWNLLSNASDTRTTLAWACSTELRTLAIGPSSRRDNGRGIGPGCFRASSTCSSRANSRSRGGSGLEDRPHSSTLADGAAQQRVGSAQRQGSGRERIPRAPRSRGNDRCSGPPRSAAARMVVLVEDQDDARRMLKLVLETHGVTVETARTAARAPSSSSVSSPISRSSISTCP